MRPSNPPNDSESSDTWIRPTSFNILVLEPDPDRQHRYSKRLAAAGHRVVGAGSRGAADALLERWTVEVALLSESVSQDVGFVAYLRATYPELRIACITSGQVRVTADGVFHIAPPKDDRDLLSWMSERRPGPAHASPTRQRKTWGAVAE